MKRFLIRKRFTVFWLLPAAAAAAMCTQIKGELSLAKAQERARRLVPGGTQLAFLGQTEHGMPLEVTKDWRPVRHSPLRVMSKMS